MVVGVLRRTAIISVNYAGELLGNQFIILANCWEISSLCWRTAGKSVHYAGELVVPKPHDAVRRHLPFQDSQW